MASKNIKCSLKVLDGGTAAIVLPSPTDISFGKERVCKEQRAMDGTMVIDMIAVKNSYELMWDVMNGSVMKKLRAMLESSGNTFFEIAMTLKTKDLTDYASGSGDEGVDTQAFEEDIQMGGTVYLSDMTYTPYFINGGFVWKDVSVKFVER